MSEICPICKDKIQKVSRQCPMRDSIPVCTNCCLKCEYAALYEYEGKPLARCDFYRYDPRTKEREEIGVLNGKIHEKERLIDWLYKNNKPWRAESVEQEVRSLKLEQIEVRRRRGAEWEKIMQKVKAQDQVQVRP